MKRRPTKGDKVKILRTSSPIPPKYAGQIGEIIEDDHSSCPYLIRFDDGADWWFPESKVDLIINNPAISERRLKVGDRVRVKSREWYEANRDINGDVYIKTPRGECRFNEDMAHWCGKVVTISKVDSTPFELYKFRIKEDMESWCWSSEMFDSDEPQSLQFIFSDWIKSTLDYVSLPSFFVKGSKPTIAGNLPLIHKHKLLTNIKLD